MVSSDEVIDAFKNGYKAQGGNYFTDGNRLYLFGNLIAERMHNGQIRATNAGYATVTTHKTLNRLGANISRRGGKTFQNGNEYQDGNWFNL